jgi:integrase
MAAVIEFPKTSIERDNQPPIRRPNQASRAREYLTPDEVERMIAAARRASGRLAERDALLIMMAYRHGLRASELIALRWDQIDLKAGTLNVARLKHGSPSTHPLRGPELRALRAWKREQCEATHYVFTSLRAARSHGARCITSLRKPRKRPTSSSPCICTCSGTRQASIWRMPARIRVRSSCTSDTRIFSTRSGTPSWLPADLRISGKTN